MGIRTLVFYALTGIVAILIGLALVNTIRPGVSCTRKPLLQMEGIESFSSSFNAESEKLKRVPRLIPRSRACNNRLATPRSFRIHLGFRIYLFEVCK